MKLKVHLVYPGTCEEAFNLYKEALNGEIVFTFRKKEDKTFQAAETDKEKISHMVLNTQHFELAGEDANSGEIVENGNNNKLVLSFYNPDDLHRVFNLLSKDGTIVSPLEKTFFTEAIGEIIDKYGIYWIIMMSDDNYSA